MPTHFEGGGDNICDSLNLMLLTIPYISEKKLLYTYFH